MLKIGVFDSGLGGLTIVKSIGEIVKGIELFYIADTLHAPYGEKTPKQILEYSLNITQYLIIKHKIEALVIACNTATSAAVKSLRERYPELIIIGTEPAVKPAVEQTRSGHVGILATPATLKGDKYQALVDRVAGGKKVTLHEQACPGLVEHIEGDTLESAEAIELLRGWLDPMVKAGVDTLVLGCTHYPLAVEAIGKIVQKDTRMLDAGQAVARHLLHSLEERGHINRGSFDVELFATADIDEDIAHKILNSDKKLTHIEII